MISAALATHLAALGLARWAGSGPDGALPAFVEDLPDQPDAALCVVTRPSFPPPDLTGYGLPEVQVIVRHGQSATDRNRRGYELADAVRVALDGTSETTWAAGGADEIEVLTCTASSSSPVPLGPDQAGRPRWSISFQLEAPITA